MSYRWGFDLDMAAVRLMRREAGHWREVAIEKIDSADIEDRLQAMAEQIDEGAPVDVFLPTNQILFTDVNVSSEDAAQGEIERAMEGMTPYTLEDLAIDWEMTGPKTARVAAIARETLDEAYSFAEARGRVVSGYSTLAEPSEFPRLPDFGGMEISDDDAFVAPVPFTSSRPRSEPKPLSDRTTGQASPVVKVDDTTPVMQVDTRDALPLDPGLPLNPELAMPRVSTDIAASTISDEVAATLSPQKGPAVRLHRAGGVSTLMVFAVAFLLTIGIAFVVWSVLPLSPGRESPAATAPVNGALAPEAPETEVAVAPETVAPEPEIAEPEVAAVPEPAPEPVVPDLPVPVVTAEVPAQAEPVESSEPPVFPVALAAIETLRTAPSLMSTTSLEDPLPGVAQAAPLPPSPIKLAGLATTAPNQGPDPREIYDESTDTIYIASIEHSSLAFDAIALPNVSAINGGVLPVVGEAPVPFADFDPLAQAIERAVIASIEPSEPIVDDPTPIEIAPATETEIPDENISEPEGTEPQTPVPTALAAALPERAPRARPSGFTASIERDQFGGRTRDELSKIRPGERPESAQTTAQRETASNPPSALAVATAPPPRLRPPDFDAIVAQSLIQREAARVTASIAFDTPDTSSAIEAALEDDAEPEVRPQDTPRLAIPSNVSVARQATIENAIRLNRINLVGVYGAPSDRRALVRLSSGRYIKVKVGDRIDGGTVAQITDSALLYKKGRRTLSLNIPKG